MTCTRPLTYREFVDQESRLIRSDGCSKASGAYAFHCRVHDLEYWYAADAVDAYRWYLLGAGDYWRQARAITQAEADAHLRDGMQSDSPLGFFSPMAIIRWGVLKAIGKRAWSRHRAREQDASGGPHG